MKIRQALKIRKRLFLGNLIIDYPVKLLELQSKNRLDFLRARGKAIRYQMDCKGSSIDRSWDLFWSRRNQDKLTRTWVTTFFKKIDK
jgi:hypothetical protein